MEPQRLDPMQPQPLGRGLGLHWLGQDWGCIGFRHWGSNGAPLDQHLEHDHAAHHWPALALPWQLTTYMQRSPMLVSNVSKSPVGVRMHQLSYVLLTPTAVTSVSIVLPIC